MLNEIQGMQSESLRKFMNEIAEEIGIHDYLDSDKSKIAAGVHGYVGGSASKLANKLGQMIISETPVDQVRALMDKYDLRVDQETIDKYTN